MPRHSRYLATCHALRARYARTDGLLIYSTGGQPTRYAILEAWAAMRYLGCNPEKLTFIGTGRRLSDYL